MYSRSSSSGALKSAGTTNSPLQLPAFGTPVAGGRVRLGAAGRSGRSPPGSRPLPRLDGVQQFRQALLSLHHRNLDHGYAPSPLVMLRLVPGRSRSLNFYTSF